MNRRKFICSSGAGAAAAAAATLTGGVLEPASVSAQSNKKVLMKVGANATVSEEGLNAVLRYGIKNITANAPIEERQSGRLYATVDELKAMRDVTEKKGVSVDILTPPNLASSHIDWERNPGIMLGKSPERDREIEGVQTMIKNCAAAGIPGIKYNMSILGVLRMGRVPGRADTSYTHFKIAGAKADPHNGHRQFGTMSRSRPSRAKGTGWIRSSYSMGRTSRTASSRPRTNQGSASN